MKLKSGLLLICIIICLFTISSASAGEVNDAVMISEDDSQIELSQINEITQDNAQTNGGDANNPEASSQNSNLRSDSNDVKSGSGEQSSSFSQFHEDLINGGNTFNLTRDYAYNGTGDDGCGTFKIKTLVINGNNHILDGKKSKFKFNFSSISNEGGGDNNTKGYCNLTINDLTFTNFGNSVIGFMGCNLTFNNVNFTNCSTYNATLISVLEKINLTLNNCNFYSNAVYKYIDIEGEKLIIKNSNFSGNDCTSYGIGIDRGQMIIENSQFENFTAKHGSIINFKGHHFAIKNSKFLNSKADFTGGAIIAKYFPVLIEVEPDVYVYFPTEDMLIENCTFFNLSSSSNGGAIHLDLDSAREDIDKTLIVANSNFTDCSSKFGGAISILGGFLNISSSNFNNNRAGFEGGAVYSSWTNVTVVNSSFVNNKGVKNAGALFFDKGTLKLNGSNFTNNKALKQSEGIANAIYAHDVNAYFSNSVFDNGGVAVYADFAGNSKMENIEKNDDIFLLDNHDYIVSVENKGIKINLIRNELIVDALSSKFDARDWGWATPGKRQGENDDCWAFATVASLDASLLKSTGVAYNLSQNYVQKLQLKYFKSGDLRNSLTGFSYSGLGYALSWYGVLLSDNGYDDRGMIADTDMDVERIHVQDAMIIHTGQNDTVDLLKRAIMKYGAVSVEYLLLNLSNAIKTEGEDIAIMNHGTHFISLIGWDDNYNSSQNGSYGKFAWIAKDSLDGFSPYNYTNFPFSDYYAIVPQSAAIAYIFENDIDYHVNYQTDLTGLTGFDANFTHYSNEFTSKYDELIGAVGTYFNASGINYSFDIYVNGAKVHSQNGVSEFAGFRTIVLNKYIPIKTGDKFKVVFKSNAVPYQAYSRQHYIAGMTFASADGKSWSDITLKNKTVCLKVYTVADDTKITGNKDIVVDYDGGSYFSVKVVTADGREVGPGEVVKFTINGKTTTVKTDINGIAKIKITELPKKYTITTAYNGISVKNTVTVKQVLTASKVTVKKTAKKFALKAKLKINGRLVKGKVITFKFKGKTYKVKTNSKGIAQKILKKKVIKKLKKGKKYTVKVAYGKDSIRTTVKVR